MAASDLALDLLVFRASGSRFGLDAAQIGEVLRLEDLQVLTSCSGATRCVLREGAEIPVVELASVIGMRGATPHGGEKLVVPRSGRPRVAFLLGDLEEMVRVEAGDIELLPPPIGSMVAGSGMWGVARCDGELVILIDLVEAAERSAGLSWVGPGCPGSVAGAP